MRRHQHSYERTLPADRLRKDTVRILRRRSGSKQGFFQSLNGHFHNKSGTFRTFPGTALTDFRTGMSVNGTQGQILSVEIPDPFFPESFKDPVAHIQRDGHQIKIQDPGNFRPLPEDNGPDFNIIQNFINTRILKTLKLSGKKGEIRKSKKISY